MTPNFMAILEEWCQEAGKVNEAVLIKFTMGPTDRPKRAAWAEVEDSRFAAQLTVWVTGECEAEVYSLEDGSALLRKSEVVRTSEEFEGVIKESMDRFFE